MGVFLIYRTYVFMGRITKNWRFYLLSNIFPKVHYSSGRLYSINSPTSILRYQHNLQISPVSKRLTPSRQYLLKLVRGISRSLQILFLLIPFSCNISFIRICKLPYSIEDSPLLFYHYFIIMSNRNIIYRYNIHRNIRYIGDKHGEERN